MSLRDQLIEGMSEAYRREWLAWANERRGHRPPDFDGGDRRVFSAALDALLDTLADKWPQLGNGIEDALIARVGRSSDRTIETVVTSLVAALREDAS